MATLYDQLSIYAANKILEHMLGVQSWTAPESVWLALYTSDPGEDDTGTEVTDAGYARQELSFANASNGRIATNAGVTFGPFSGSVTVSHWGIRDAESGGNLLVHGPLVDEQTKGDETTVFDITVDGCIVTYTYTGTGKDPEISSSSPAPGHAVVITSSNFNPANTGRFVVIDSGTNWFSVANEDGVPQDDVAVGSGGSIVWLEPAPAQMANRIRLTFQSGCVVVRLS